ncbi:uncharacterized protein MICPUCDRAFT_42706 [Micromonas pusilla CCMP1545]|uniref:Predicted protein n=1 Tax=Micromonas pusilla (strain CCMP1545) TaxID=564608 RepID=C1N5U3_MICPC|nr:uncharacterized protein MICPUCDRAFT_42706 [Micromonas pusilla CCMP1545]EEH52562.1 predicted protein [Micromonas pusilla CCMP1545]|eukprot:XP_003063426.1 predicted protein [Micromonas pusilla CCMP1545]
MLAVALPPPSAAPGRVVSSVGASSSSRRRQRRLAVAMTASSPPSSSRRDDDYDDDDDAGEEEDAKNDDDDDDELRVTYRGREARCRRGATLRTALLRAGLSPHNDAANVINCRGLGTCGTCAVEVTPRDAASPSSWTTMEAARLRFPPHASPGNRRLRLACQVRVESSCAVVKRTKFWGQGDAAAPDLSGEERPRVPPLGALEYALDPDEWRAAGGRRSGGGDGGDARRRGGKD